MDAAEDAETLLCDTSFVSIMQSSERSREVIASWPADVKARVDSAILAISVITLAEIRGGHVFARWGNDRRARAEQLLGAYLHVPLDVPTLSTWAEIFAATRRAGHTLPHNDLWIAAAALNRGLPLVSCDRHFDAVPNLEHIYLPPRLVADAT